MSVLLALTSVAQSVVLIAASVQGGATKTGTGFVISSTSAATQILTAAHVVEGAAAPDVYLGGPHGRHYIATLVRFDRLRDVALLQIPEANLPTIALASAVPPVSGTSLEVMGYPTLAKPAPNASPGAMPSPLPLAALEMVAATGKADGVAEQGESILFDIPISHGDSGAPVVDMKTNAVVGMVLGIAGGYDVARWMSGDGLGLSVAALNAFLGQLFPATTPAAPAFAVAMQSDANADIAASAPALGSSAGFVIAQAGKSDPCRTDPNGPASANAVINEEVDSDSLTIDVADCSGTPFYRDGMTALRGGLQNMLRVVHRGFLGYVDTHPAEWTSLLTFGIAVDPVKNPYLALMSVDRNPFGQLRVDHVFRGGPADLAGLRPNDAILKIDGRPTRALADPFVARLLNQPSVTLLLDRDEQTFSARLRLKRFSELTAKGPVPH